MSENPNCPKCDETLIAMPSAPGTQYYLCRKCRKENRDFLFIAKEEMKYE